MFRIRVETPAGENKHQAQYGKDSVDCLNWSKHDWKVERRQDSTFVSPARLKGQEAVGASGPDIPRGARSPGFSTFHNLGNCNKREIM